MTHPSDDTFLDEMAQRPIELLKAYSDGSGLWGTIVEHADLQRLVALARRAPALTCGTCRHYEPQLNGEQNVIPFGRCHRGIRQGGQWTMGIYVGVEFGCKLWHDDKSPHAPAPPEARP